MANPHRGTVAIEIGGKDRTLKFDLNALAEVEDKLKLGGINDVIPLLERVSIRTVRCLLWAGLIHEDPDLTEREVGSWTIDVREVVPLLAQGIGIAFAVSVDTSAVKGAEGNGARPKTMAGTGSRS